MQPLRTRSELIAERLALIASIEAATKAIRATLRQRQGLPPEKFTDCRNCGDVGCAQCGK